MSSGTTTTLHYGYLSLLKPGTNKVRNQFPLTKQSLTFGSKLHAQIDVDSVAPYDATLTVFGSNGLSVNGNQLSKDRTVLLQDGDLIVICERLFKWESANEHTISLDSPASARHRPLRYSLINAAATACTPAKPQPRTSTLSIPRSASSSLFSTLLTPLRAGAALLSPAPPAEPSAQSDEDAPASPISWDEPAEEAGGDLITWEEVDDEDDELEDELAELQVEEHCIPTTPALTQRARVLRAPASERRAVGPRTPGGMSGRRMSMRMTIVPAERVQDWVRERDENRKEAEAARNEDERHLNRSDDDREEDNSSDEDQPPSPSRQSSTHLAPAWPSALAPSPSRRSISPAGRPSLSSRRVSHMLLTPAQALAQEAAEAAGLAAGAESSSDSDSSEEDFEYEVEQDYIEPIEASEDEGEGVERGEISIGYPFPSVGDSAVESDTPDEVEAEQDAVVPVADSDAEPSPIRTPRHTLTRRLSLREKVLIRSAIKATTPPLDAPIAASGPTPEPVVDVAPTPVAAPELEVAPIEDVEMTDAEASDESSSSSEDDVDGEPSTRPADEPGFSSRPVTPVRPQDVPLPTSIKFAPRSPEQLTLSPRHRDSIELVRARNQSPAGPPTSSLNTSPIRWAPETPTQRSPVAAHIGPAPLSPGSDEEGEVTDENLAPEEMAVPAPTADRATLILSSAVKPIARPPSSTPLATLFSGSSTPLQSAKQRSIFTPRAAPSSGMQQQQSAARNFFAAASDSPGDFVIPLKTPRSVPIPATPAGGANTWVFSRDEPTPNAADSDSPERAAARARIQARRAFSPEMTSPVNGHRLMATPKSAMKTGVLKGRRKSVRGVLEAAVSPRKSVVFNEQLFVKEVRDIRDRSLHWNARYDQDEEVQVEVERSTTPTEDPFGSVGVAAASSPALGPAPSAVQVMLTPIKAPVFTAVGVSPFSAPPSEARKPQRVPTDTPCESVRKAVHEVAALSGSPAAVGTPVRRAGRVLTPARAVAHTPSTGAGTALLGTPVARVAGRAIVSTQTPPLSAAGGVGASMSARRAQIASLRKAGRVGGVLGSAASASRTVDLQAKLAEVRRKSMPPMEGARAETPVRAREVGAVEEIGAPATPEQVAHMLGARPTPKTEKRETGLLKEVAEGVESEQEAVPEADNVVAEPAAVDAGQAGEEEGAEVASVREAVAAVSLRDVESDAAPVAAVEVEDEEVASVVEVVSSVAEAGPAVEQAGPVVMATAAPAPTRRTTRKLATAAASSIPTRATRATRTTRAVSAEVEVEEEQEEPAKPAARGRKAATSAAVAAEVNPKAKAPAARARSKSVSKKTAPVAIREDTPPLPDVPAPAAADAEAPKKAVPARASRRVLAAANADEVGAAAEVEVEVKAPVKKAGARSGIRAPRAGVKNAEAKGEEDRAEAKEENAAPAAVAKKITRARKVAEPAAVAVAVSTGRSLRSRG